MPAQIDGMATVATGVPAIVTRWCIVLRSAGIEFAVTRQDPDEVAEAPGSLNLWVEKRRVEAAKAAIIKAETGKASFAS